ncbi:unnamed protein product [Owenia fusiformis]|uniref:HP domain-containing protein n=1 Tax=Owenia fusiformis TaxID=6347 RepID=A0A8S4PKQ8_OWEFU|nr:unnamed protein product [Owenia fusiformis]
MASSLMATPTSFYLQRAQELRPIQHREVQDHESKLFLSYYKAGIRYLKGGVKSGLSSVSDIKFKKKLLQVKGKRNVRVREVPCKCASLTKNDVFILDCGQEIWVWIGPNSNRMEKLKGTLAAKAIRDDRDGKAKIYVVEQNWESDKKFFEALGSKDKEIKAGDPDDRHNENERGPESQCCLYRCSFDDNLKIQVEEVAQRPLSKGMLNSNCCYVLDSGIGGVWVWTGKKCSIDFKKFVWKNTEEFLDYRGYPDWTPMTRVTDGGESPLFKQYFEIWQDDTDQKGLGDVSTVNQVAEQSDDNLDGADLHKMTRPATSEDYMPDDGSGEIKIYRIEGNDLEEIPKELHGIFFGGDCYIVAYMYKDESGKDKYIIYFWQGQRATTEDKAASALQTITLDDHLGGQALQIRVVMNKEPKHFLKLFHGRLVVFQIGQSKGFRSMKDHAAYNPTAMLFEIRGNEQDLTRALQVEDRAASLNSNSVFMLDTKDKTYVWVGKNANDSEKEMAQLCCEFIGEKEPEVIVEGEESFRFWDAIGGQEEYYKGPPIKDSNYIPPRLFHCSISSGKFTVEEIFDFQQQDLDEDDVMILDAYTEVFVWIGQNSAEVEKLGAYKTAIEYIESDPSGRTKDNTMIVVVRQGCEPPFFTGHFHGWDAEIWSKGLTWEQLVAQVGEENAGVSLVEEEVEKYFKPYSYKELLRSPPPEGVDPTCKEQYLSEEEFLEVFGMARADYEKMPKWKQINLKKSTKLF